MVPIRIASLPLVTECSPSFLGTTLTSTILMTIRVIAVIQEWSDTLQTNESLQFAGTIEEKVVLLLRLLGWKDVRLLLLAAHSERQRDGRRKNVEISLNS